MTAVDVRMPTIEPIVKSAPPHRRPTRVRIIAVVAAVAIIVTGLSISLYRATYSASLENGSTGGSQQGVEVSTFRDAQLNVTYRGGQTWWYRFSLRNSGNRSVKITALPSNLSERGLLTLRRVLVARCDDGCTDGFVPFGPFDLAPGAERSIQLSFSFNNCRFYEAGSTWGFTSWPVRYSALGHSRTVDFELETAVAVTSPPDAQCPHRATG